MDKLADVAEEIPSGKTVRVKFKGSKLAMGSSKTPFATVDTSFMLLLTALNKSMLHGAATFVTTKKKKRVNDDVGLNVDEDARYLAHKRKSQSEAPNFDPINTPEDERDALTIVSKQDNVEAYDFNMPRDRTVGILCLSPESAPFTHLSSYFMHHQNRKQFQKLVDAIDTADMNITCAYDFWLWLEAQNLFSPLSYKTHDLSALTLSDIGGKTVRKRWHQPSQTDVAAAPVGIVAEGGGGGGDGESANSGGNAGDAFGSLRTHPTVAPIAVEASMCTSGFPLGLTFAAAHTSRSPHFDSFVTASDFLFDEDGRHGVSSSHALAAHQQRWGDSCASSSSSGEIEMSRHLLTAQGVDEPSSSGDVDEMSCHPTEIATTQSEDATIFRDTNLSIEDHLVSLNESLLREHIRVNALLARLRKDALQGPAARSELEDNSKFAEREKVVLTRWRKAKLQPSSIHSGKYGHIGQGGGSTSKGKPAHKKKLGSY